MRDLPSLLAAYGESHQDPRNVLIHWICVPVIAASTVGLLAAIPFPSIFDSESAVRVDWAILAIGGVSFIYWGWSRRLAVVMLLLLVTSHQLMVRLDERVLPVSVALFGLAWAAQLMGHRLEKKKPSFVDDLIFLLVGPLYFLHKLGVSGVLKDDGMSELRTYPEAKALCDKIYADTSIPTSGRLGPDLGNEEKDCFKMKAMFSGTGRDQLPIRTEIYSVAITAIPDEVSEPLERFAGDFANLLGPTHPIFVAPRSSYHISLLVPQDVAAKGVKGGMLKPYTSRFDEQHLDPLKEALRRHCEKNGPFELQPIGFRFGSDGTLFFAFDLPKPIFDHRRAIDRLTKEVTGHHPTSRDKPIVAITLVRLIDPIEAPAGLGDFVSKAKGPATQSVPPLRVEALEFTHETRWMRSETGECSRLPLMLP